MATATLGTFLQRLKQSMSAESLASCSDVDLIERFRATRDDAAFRAILDRHGPMVFRVCRRQLTSNSDIEDAFQATFLILVRRGHTIRRHAALGSWLHGVAHRTALKLGQEIPCANCAAFSTKNSSVCRKHERHSICCKRIDEIDQRIKKLQEEIDKLQQERQTTVDIVSKSQAAEVKSKIPEVLSREAVQTLRQITLQRMRLSDVLLNAKIRDRLELNDEQIKKIHELVAAKRGQSWALDAGVPRGIQWLGISRMKVENDASQYQLLSLLSRSDDVPSTELMKLLTARQRETLERLSGIKTEKAK